MKNKFDVNNNAKFTIDDLLEIMKTLRSPNGCPWDREQTHKSVRREFIEECYEAVEAIDTDNKELLREELGDVLLQIVFHCEMEKEMGGFEFADVVNEIARKLIIRHPHVFGNVEVKNTDEVLTNWDKIKKDTKGQKSIKETFESITTAMPALMRHQKYVKKAMKYGISQFSNSCDIKISEENVTACEIGEALAKIVAIAQQNGIDAEEELSKITKQEINKISV